MAESKNITEQQGTENRSEAKAGKPEEILKRATEGFEWMITEEGDRLNVITIKKRKIPLRLVLSDIEMLSSEVGNISEMQELLGDDILSASQIKNIIKTIRILGNSGLEAMGKEPDLTDKWLGDRMRVQDVNQVLTLNLMLAIWGGMEMETEEEEGEVDVVLEDLRKKKEPAS